MQAFLTSLEGARGVLSHYCDQGIYTNKDYEVAAYAGALKMRARDANIFHVTKAGGMVRRLRMKATLFCVPGMHVAARFSGALDFLDLVMPQAHNLHVV